MKRLFPAVLLSCALHAQTFDGMVYDARSGAPLTSVRVAANSNGQAVTTVTDSAGRFRVAAATQYRLDVTFLRAGYLTRNDSFAPGAAGNTELRVPLMPCARLAGQIVDADGLAVRDIEVVALRLVLSQGQRGWARAASVRTDDLGRFRITDVSSGRYRLQAKPGPSEIARWDARYTTSYYPAGADATQAKTIEITTGQQVDGLNFQLVRQEGVTVSGRLVMPAGSRPPASLYLMTEESSAFWRSSNIATSVNQNDGSFLIRHVPPGTLNLRVQSNALPGQTAPFTGRTRLQVANSDIRGVELEIHSSAPFDLPGRVTLSGKAPGVPIRIGVRANNSNVGQQAETDGTGAFTLKGLSAGDYSLNGVSPVNPAGAAALQVTVARFGSAVMAQFGTYIHPGTNAALEIDVVELDARLTVEVKDAAGQPLPLAFVQLLDERSQLVYGGWQVTQGRRRLMPPAGTYRVIVWPESARPQDFLEADYIDTHKNDFPPVQLNAGDNPPLVLKMPPR